MTECLELPYNAAYVPMREPSLTWEFDDHVYDCLDLALLLYEEGVVESIVPVGGLPKWYEREGIQAPYDAESDVGLEYLIKQGYTGPQLQERLSQTSMENHLRAAEDVFIRNGMRRVLMISALERLPRLNLLREQVITPDEVSVFHITAAGRARKLRRKEDFAGVVQREFLPDVPKGRQGWDVLRASEYEGPLLLPFWKEFDATKAALHEAMPPGVIPDISDIVDRMSEESLEPGMKAFAMAAATGRLALPNIMESPAYRSVQDLRSLAPLRA